MNQAMIDDLNAVLEKHGWKFRFGQYVEKKKGQSGWSGHVCGIYVNDQTLEGYAVVSDKHQNATQIYPLQALEADKTTEV